MSEHITKDKAEQILSYGKPHRYTNISRDVIPRALVTVIAQAEQIKRLQAGLRDVDEWKLIPTPATTDLIDLGIITPEDMETPK